jgi:iron complex outermembrane receptor protein
VVSGGTGAWSGLVAARRYASDGDFSYRNEFLFPPRSVDRKGADIQTTTVYGRATWDPSRISDAGLSAPTPQWTIATWITRADRGLPGPASTSSGSARQWDRLGRVWIDGRLPIDGGRLAGSTLDLQAQGQVSSLRYTNAVTEADRISRTQSADISADLQLPPSPRGTLHLGASAGYDHASLRGGVEQMEAAVSADGRLRAGPLRLEPALRLDATWLDGSATIVPTPRLGVSVAPLGDERLVLKGLLARAFRVPTFNERYYEPGGNPTLHPEDGWSAELGMLGQIGVPGWSVEAEVTGYTSRLTDQIVWQPSFVTDGVQVWRPGNVGAVRTWGLDVSLRGRIAVTDALTLRAGSVFTHTRAENRANRRSPAYGAQLPYVPPQQLKLWGGAAWNGLSVDLSGRLVGARYYSTDESQRLDPYQVLDLRAAYRLPLPGVDVTADVGIDNLLDERYQVVRLYPMPPRHLSASLTLSLTP